MNSEVLDQMSIVTAALFQREYNAIQKILHKETNLRKSLAQLDAQSFNPAGQGDQFLDMKTIGAGFLWLAWVSKTKQNLNIELAQIMAQKADAMGQVRKAFGQTEAVRNLESDIRQGKIQKTARLRSEQLSLYL